MKAKQVLTGIVMSAFLSLAPVHAEQNMVATNEAGAIYNLTEKEGLKKIQGLAASRSKENGWYFIPETGEWIDCGIDIEDSGFTMNLSILVRLRPNIREAINHHPHPGSINLLPPDFPLEELKNLGGCFVPSPKDVDSFLKEIDYFKQHNIEIIEHRIVDGQGYWSLRLQSSDLDEIRKPSFFEKYKDLARKHEGDYITMYPLNMKNRKVLDAFKSWSIKSFEREAAGLGLDIQYHRL